MASMDARIVDEAAYWLARWHASDFSEAERAALTRWRNQSARHEDVWRQAEQLKSRLGAVPPAVGMAVLDRPSRAGRRRQILRAAAWALVTPAAGWIAYRQLPWQNWTADFRTAKGESRDVTLADGSRVLLNTASAISVRFDHGARRLTHYAGEILVQTSHASQYAALPFVVRTDDGRMQALGTRFIVRKYEDGTALSVLDGAVKVAPLRAVSSVVVQAGEQVRFDRQGASPVVPVAPQADAWTRGVLYAEDMPLKDFLAELARYREGILSCDSSAADLRVSGTYQTRDTDRILQLLEETLPVRIQRRTRYWVTVTRS